MKLAWGQPQQQQQPGMNYAGAVKNEQIKQENMQHQQQQRPGQQRQPPMKDQGGPSKKKPKLEQMGFGNMGSGFGCSLFVPNQGEEMPTMLQMGYAGEAPGMGFGDDVGDNDPTKSEVKTEPKTEATMKMEESKPTLGKMQVIGGKTTVVAGQESQKKAEWPPSLMDYISRAFSSCRNDQEKDKTEKYLKNILNGRLKSGSVNEIDWENEPLPKDIFTDKNKDQKSKDINKSRDTLFDPNKDKNEETNFGIYDTAPRKMTKSEKKKKKAGALANLNPDMFEVDDPMSNLKKAARNMRFQSEQAQRNKTQKRQVPLSLQLVGDNAPRQFDPNKMKIVGTSDGT